jgi:AraC-like DNA-binding protein
VKKLNDQLVDSIGKQAIRLSLDIYLQDAAYITHYDDIRKDSSSVKKLLNIYQILCETANINYRIQSIYFYPNDADFVVTSNRGFILKKDFTDTGWIKEYEEIKRKQTGTLWLNSRPLDIPKNTPWQNNNNVLTFILPMNTNSGVIVVNLYERELYNFMNESDTQNNGYVFVINDKGIVISHKDKNLINQTISNRPYIKNILLSKETTGYFINNVNGKNKMFTYYKSEFNNWIYVGVYPMDNLLNNTRAMRNGTSAIILFLMFAGVIATYFFSRSMYNPVKKLMQEIQKRKGIDFREGGNEMAILSRVFDALAKQEDMLSNALDKNRQELKDKYLMDLLKGSLDEVSALNPSNPGIEFKYAHFLCFIIVIDRIELFRDKYSSEQQYYMKKMILKACEELAEQSFNVNGVLYEKKKIAVVVNFEDYTPEIAESLRSYLLLLQNEVSKVMTNTISIGVGNDCVDINSLNVSFSEALEALSNRIVYGSGSIIYYNELPEFENKYYYPFQIETHILNYLKLGAKQELLDAVGDLIRELKSRKGLSADNILQIFKQMIGNTVKYLVELNINVANVFGSGYNIYQKLASKETLEDIATWLCGFYSGILQYMADNGDTGKSDAGDKVMDYLHQNYRANIDTTSIATNTGMSYSSIGRIIKSKTGKNVLEYINGLRIEEAKRLLRQTSMNITDIAMNVGYNNDQSFSRFFKKFEGVTPGEFRNLRNQK